MAEKKVLSLLKGKPKVDDINDQKSRSLKSISEENVTDFTWLEEFKRMFGNYEFTGSDADKVDDRVSAEFVHIIQKQIEKHVATSHDLLGDYMVCVDGGNIEVRKWVMDIPAARGIPAKRRLQSFAKSSDLTLLFDNMSISWPEVKQFKNRSHVEWKQVNPFTVWKNSREHRPTFHNVVYAPVRFGETPSLPPKTLNLYQGWPLQPDFDGHAKKCQKIRDHILHILCEGDHGFYEWIISWMAHKIQMPAEKIGTAIALRSGQGVGKGTIITDVFGKILGQHFKHLINIGMVTGRFNAGFEDASVVFLDEAFFTKDQEAASKLKGLITEKELTQERKYKDPTSKPVVFDIIIATNFEQAAPVEVDDRRYTIADIEAKPQSKEYFNELHAEIRSGGREAFFAFLLDWDLEEAKADVTKPYETKGRMKQKLQNLKMSESWWYDVLRYGSFGNLKCNGYTVDWSDYAGKLVPRGLFVTAALEYHQRMRSNYMPKSKTLTASIQKWCPSLMNSNPPAHPQKFDDLCFSKLEGGDRQRGFVLPSLDAARHDFETFMGGEIDWDEDVHAHELQVDFDVSAGSAPVKNFSDSDEPPF